MGSPYVQNKEASKVQSVELNEPSEEDEETEIASQAPSLTPRQLPSLTSNPL